MKKLMLILTMLALAVCSLQAQNLDVEGSVKIVDGTQGTGKVLTSDANGVATWQTPSGGGSSLWSQSGSGSDIFYNSGNIGIGITNPSDPLHLYRNGLASIFIEGDGTSDARLKLDNGAGSHYIFDSPNSGNALGIQSANDLIIYTNFAERMRIMRDNGNVGIGTTSPSEILDVNGKIAITADAGDEMVIINGDTWQHSAGPQTFNNGQDNFIMASREGSGESGGIYGDGSCVTIWSPGDGVTGGSNALLAVCDEDRFDSVDTDPYNSTALTWYLTESGGWIASDINRKENINAFTNSLDKIAQLDVFTYNYKMNQEEKDKGQIKSEVVGIIAQDLHKVLPQAVNITENGEHFVNYNQVTPVLIGAINELSTSNETLQAENTELKNRLTQLEAAVEALTRE